MVVLLVALLLLAAILAIRYSTSKKVLNDESGASEKIFLVVLVGIGLCVAVVMCNITTI